MNTRGLLLCDTKYMKSETRIPLKSADAGMSGGGLAGLIRAERARPGRSNVRKAGGLKNLFTSKFHVAAPEDGRTPSNT